MSRYAVSYINWYDYKLDTIIVSADSILESLWMHPKIEKENFENVQSLEDAQSQAFDIDSMINSVEIP